MYIESHLQMTLVCSMNLPYATASFHFQNFNIMRQNLLTRLL